jgi:phosphoribosyl 1,2-cyclic phosphodiesterase
MLEFHPHSSSSAGNFCTATDGKSTLALDCGIRYQEIQKALDFRVTKLDGLLITHGHGDHCQSASKILNCGVDAWASEQTWAKLGLSGNHCAHAAEPLKPFDIGGWRILPFDAVHDEQGCLGYLITGASGESMIFLVDSCYSLFKFPRVKILAVECNHSVEIMRRNVKAGIIDQDRFNRTLRTHMSLERLLDLLAANDLSKVQEIHLLHLSDANSDADGFKEAIERATGIPCKVAQKMGGTK